MGSVMHLIYGKTGDSYVYFGSSEFVGDECSFLKHWSAHITQVEIETDPV